MKTTNILVISVALFLHLPALRAIDLIGNPDSDWATLPGNADGSFALDEAPRNITSGTPDGILIEFTPASFSAPTPGSTYTFAGSMLFPEREHDVCRRLRQ